MEKYLFLRNHKLIYSLLYTSFKNKWAVIAKVKLLFTTKFSRKLNLSSFFF